MTVAVLGATGYTGRLVCEEARAAGIPLRLVGRDERKLADVAVAGEETRVADAASVEGLARAFEGASAVVSLAGPFLAVGFGPVSAAIAAGAHYVDSAAEQAYTRRIYEEFGAQAEARGVVLLSAFGFDYVPGDLAARLAADGLEPLDELAVAYSVVRMASSRGMRRTIARLVGEPHAAFAGGELVESSFGATTRRMRFPSGERDVVEWGGGEPLTVPRHTEVAEVRSYLRAPALAAKAAPLASLGAPALRLASGLGPEGPSAARRRKSRFAIVAEARGPQGSRRVTITGHDVYGLTARILVRGLEGLLAGEVARAGALAPAQAFPAGAFLDRLGPLVEECDVRSGT